MILLTFLYDEYIDKPKLSEQKKPFEYIIPPPTSGVGTIIIRLREKQSVFNKVSKSLYFWIIDATIDLIIFSSCKIPQISYEWTN